MEALYLQGLTVDQLRQIIREELAATQPPPLPEVEFIDLNQLHQALNGAVSKGTLRNWSKKGLLNANKIGRRVLYRKAETMEAIQRLKPYQRT